MGLSVEQPSPRARSKRGLLPTQRKERDEMTSLLDRPIAANNAAKLWQTNAIKYEIIEMKFDLRH